MADNITEVRLEITPAHQIVRIMLTEADGATTEFRFAHWKENMDVADDRFHFVPPRAWRRWRENWCSSRAPAGYLGTTAGTLS